MAEETIEGFQLSPAQKHLWRQAKGDVGPHRATCVLSLAGELDAEALVRALAGIVARYEVLRTTFHRIAGMALPLQVVGEEPRFVLERHDGIGFAADRGEELGRIIEALFKLPIDLTEGPLLQAVLLARSSASHLLALSLPALCADRATLAGLCRELASTYETESGSRIETEAAADGKTPEPLQYVDYSVWQNELLEAEDTEEGRAFWRTVDRSGLATLELPYESRPKTPFSPLTLTREAGSVAAIEAAARHCGVGLAAFLLACWQALLWRLTERSDLVLGILFEGRGFAELEGTAGLLARFLPCSSRPAEGMSLRQLAVRTQKALGDAEPWQESFSWDSSGESAANAASEPYLPFCFELIDEDALSYAGGGLTFTVDQLRACIDRFKVNLRYLRHGDELVFELDFDASLLTRSAADVLADQCAQMLASATSDPELLLGDLALVGPRERNLLQVEFQDARPSAGGEERIQDLISGRSRRASEDVAVICGEVELTYGELMLRASTLAARLRACGVGAEVRVGVLCEPSPEMIVTILAILEAGGAYVPLDPGYPMERLAFILEDCGASVLVTTERLAGKLPEHRALVVVLDLPAESETGSVALRKDATSADNAAYVIYTSGSTGRPKGVVVSHRSLVSSTKARSIYYREPVSRFLLASSFAFDSSVAGIFWTLADGGSLLIWSDPSRLELAALIDLLARRQASHLLCLPSLWAEVLRQAERSRLVSLRAVIVAGESCLPDLVDRHFQVLPQTLLFNEYGPTEATVWSSVHLARPEDAAGRVPIGRPIPGIQIHLLDSDLRLVPIGTPGELYIGGAGVARGYLGHLDLTAARFCPDSLSERAGERLYRTGDLARWRPDGTLDFLGRVDHQVKIRGFRIEPGEIEALLVSHPGVHAAVVVAREDAGSEKRLVAYLVPTAGDVGVDECRDLVSSHLPAFMVPAAWVVLPELPLTPNGKVDRKALPPPADAGASVRSIYVQPRTPIEEILCTLWSEVLGVDQVGVRDDFFALGGHSLIATRVAARLNKVLGVDLPVRTLFRATTVEDLSREVESAMRSGNGLAMPPLRRLSRQKLLPLSFAQERLWFVHQLVPASTAYNIPLGLRIEGALRVEALAAALREIARRHEILRTTFTVAGGVPAQSISPEVSVALPVVDLGSLPEMAAAKEEERLSQAEAARPFDLGCGPLLRFTLLHRGTECHVILMSVHHIVFDGSFEVFLKELGAIYRALLQDRPSPLSELPVQYVDFAQWQREWLRGETLERLLSFWKDQLRGAQATVNLPADRPRPLVQGFRGSQRRAQVSGPLVGRLVALARQESVTLFMVGLAAFQALLHRYSGQNDLSVGSPVLDRPALEAEDLIGCFVNTLVMRAPVSGGSVFREHLARVREVALDAYAHRHLPFEMLVQALQPDRSLSRSPLFQVMFVLQSVSAHEPAVDLHGLRVSLLEPSSQAARFDFLLSVWHGLQGLKVNLEYDSDLFDASTAERMVSHFVRLLELVVSEVETSVSSLVLLSAGERHQLLWEWNDTLEPVGEVSIQDLVEAQVLR
ncbi:MAG TPA: amino acid adenylation domain-containing protein, partial [Thermoanaerobaculia bacterium]|nr:amino acid adenylation domain-containing protein [Thermoanaerobaculia bacterium]